MITIVAFNREDGSIGNGFLLPVSNADGQEVVASEYKDGKFSGVFERVSAGRFRATLHLNSDKIHPFINIDAQSTDVKVLCARD